MGQTEINLVLLTVTTIVFIFITGVILFVFQYRKRKLLHEKEKMAIEKQYKLDLLNTQIQSQQKTMQFIGSEIHDSVAQKLTLASIYSQKMEFENKYPELTEKIRKVSVIINDSLTELRHLSRTLVDTEIQKNSLQELLQKDFERINETGVCKVIFVFKTNSNISITIKSSLFRIIQECVQNSLKHSGSNIINVEIQDNTFGLNVKVSDHGKGFDYSHLQSNGIGISNMKRRVHLIGGSFELRSELGKGTTVEIFIPDDKLTTS